jgi:hypothetical protein
MNNVIKNEGRMRLEKNHAAFIFISPSILPDSVQLLSGRLGCKLRRILKRHFSSTHFLLHQF